MSGPFDAFLRMCASDCVNAKTTPSTPEPTPCWLCGQNFALCGHCDEGCEECAERYEAEQ